MAGLDLDGNRLLGPGEVLSTAFACNGDGKLAIVETPDEPPGASCAAGGVHVRSGIDLDGDGKLADAEVTRSSYMCSGLEGDAGAGGVNGMDGANALVAATRSTPEPVGERCAAGGERIDLGLDANKNDRLDDGEVMSSTYVCNGRHGRDGVDGRDGPIGAYDYHALVAAIEELPGPTCPAGGTQIVSGTDTNRNDGLDETEITARSYVCNGQDGANGSVGASGSTATTSLVVVTTEPAGEHCASGGQRIDVGTDADANGKLATTEITGTSYVCNGTAGTSGTDGTGGAGGTVSLVATVTEPAGTTCPAGGQKITSGPDLNANGSLDDAEVVSTSYACNGEDGAGGAASAAALVVTTTEPAGVSCPAGGTKITSGVDANGNGSLEDAEISTTSYACNGQDGDAGASGLVALTQSVAEPAGTNCAAGGTKLTSGVDLNGNGALDVSETTKTSYVCNGANGTSGANGTLALVATSATASACTYGGTLVKSGIDLNGNGNLDAGEVRSQSSVCNGAAGTNGAAGSMSLVVTASEPPGSSCTYGGTKITSGLDGNRNGVLDAAEVTSTVYACNAVPALRSLGSTMFTACASLTDGTAKCWGYNSSGQIGDGTTVSRTLPTAVVIANVQAMSAGGSGQTACAIRTGGAVSCWGLNNYGQVGDGTTTTRSSPVALTLSGADAVVAGEGHVCALMTDGTARCWGRNDLGQTGDGTMSSPKLSPVVVASGGAALGGILGLTAGANHTCARIVDGTIACWGVNGNGQLGDGTKIHRPSPVLAGGITNAIAIASGGYHMCAIVAGGTASCWGFGGSGQLGDGNSVDRTSPVPVSGLVNANVLAAGVNHSCALLTDGTARCWGNGTSGELGNGSTSSSAVPVVVSGLMAGTSLRASGHSTCATTPSGPLQCWGSNGQGQLGIGTTVTSWLPVRVNGVP
jgi:alpha-tubulin suppressor-like RCC1 family protein